MIALSKRWAIFSGAVAVAGGVALQATVLHFHDASAVTNAVTILFAPSPANVPAASQANLTPGQAAAPAAPATAAAPGKAAAMPPVAAPAPPRFDVVRVEPDGSTVVAGQGEPGAKVALLVSGKTVAETTADASGHFAFVPPALPPGGTALSLRQTAGGVTSDSVQSVAVSVPEKGGDKGGLVVALTEPGQAAKILAAPSPAPTPSPAALVPSAKPPAPGLAIRSVELENGNGFFTSGAAAPGTKLGIYLNNSHLADVVSGADSSWTVKLRQGLTPGHYTVRADAAGAPGAVAARVEVPFDVPAGASVKVASAAAPVTAPNSANAIVAEVKTTVVRAGDNLWDISRTRLGDGARYTRIYAANSAQIRDPNLIYPGQVFVVPSAGQ